MTEIRFHPGDPAAAPRVFHLNTRSPLLRAGTGLVGLLVLAGFVGTPSLVTGLARSVDRLDAHATARRGSEAFASVLRRRTRLARRVSSDELLIARLAFLAAVAPPAGFPEDDADEEFPAGRAEAEIARLARRVAGADALRRRLAAESGMVEASAIPSRSPIDPALAVPVAVFGPRLSPLTRQPEFFPALSLAAPLGTPVVAPAAGIVVFQGTAPAHAGAAWRRLGLVVVLAHGRILHSVYGHLASIAVKRGQSVSRGSVIARVGKSGWASAPALHYEVRRDDAGRSTPLDPRLFILDAEWLTAAEVRSRPSAPAAEDLPAALR